MTRFSNSPHWFVSVAPPGLVRLFCALSQGGAPLALDYCQGLATGARTGVIIIQLRGCWMAGYKDELAWTDGGGPVR